MKENKEFKVKLSTVCLILALIVIIILSYFVYKFYIEKTEAERKNFDMQTQVNSLSKTTNELQDKINTISNTITNTTTNSENTSSDNYKEEKNEVNTNNFKNEINNNISSKTTTNSEDENIENKILGIWKASKVEDSNGNDIGLSARWGSGIKYSNEMIFKKNGVLTYNIGITASSNDGKYKIEGNTIKYGLPTDSKELTWSTLTYIYEENILKEEVDDLGEKQIITYVKIK